MNSSALENMLNESLCKMLCTHLFEETEPNTVEDIPDFRTRWLANIKDESHQIKLYTQQIEEFTIIVKEKFGSVDVQIAMKDGKVVLLRMIYLYGPPRLETITNSSDSQKIMDLIGINPKTYRNWVQVDKIE